MAEHSGLKEEQDRVLATVARLVTAADGDTLYRDVYVQRAAELLSQIVTEARWQSAIAGREQATRLLAQARAAVARQDWQEVRELGKRAADVQHSLGAEEAVLSAAEAVYGAPTVVLDPLSPGLPPSSKRWPGPAEACAAVVAALTELERDDPADRELYTARRRAIEALSLPGVTVAAGDAAGAGPANAEREALRALERGDAAALEGLARQMLQATAAARPAAGETAPSARGRIVPPDVLGEPLPEACAPRARALGLECVDSTLASPAVAASISEFMERYAPSASPAAFERAKDGVARMSVAAQGLAVPPDVAAVFAETVSLFALHLYVNSSGLRYVPIPTPREPLLLETHAEGEEPVTPLLRELGLDRRRGLSRDDVEEHLWKNGRRVVAEHLGLDPLAFRVVCMPPDLFVRVGRDRGWGQRQEWTHFDGYQVLAGGRLRALVGGNARFGGLYDLCSISRDDARENTLVRFAVIRRARLGVRIG
jgi:hypothetical protein